MKNDEIAKLAVGTKLYHIYFEVCAYRALVTARVVECEVRLAKYDSTRRGAYRESAYKKGEWIFLRPNMLRKTIDEARVDLAAMVAKLRDELAKIEI